METLTKPSFDGGSCHEALSRASVCQDARQAVEKINAALAYLAGCCDLLRTDPTLERRNRALLADAALRVDVASGACRELDQALQGCQTLPAVLVLFSGQRES